MMVMVPALALPIVVEVCDRIVWKPGEPHVRTAEGLSEVMLPVVRRVDILVWPSIVLTPSVLISADLAVMVEVVNVDIVNEGRVGLFWMTGTHWPKLWMDDTLLLMYSGSLTERTQ